MSGWNPETIAPIVVAGFFFLCAINLFVPATSGAPPQWLVEARLRYGGDINLPPPDAPSVSGQRTSAAAMIFFGVLQLLPGEHSIFSRWFLAFAGGFLLVIGLLSLTVTFLWRPSTDESWASWRQRRKFEQSLARGSDAKSEELRTILSRDPPPRRPRLWEAVALVLFTLFGAAMLTLGLMEARQ